MPTTTSPFGQLTLKPARFPRTGAKLARQARGLLSIFGFASLLMVGASASAQLLGASLSTVASPSVALGGSIWDTATLSGGTKTPQGTITFKLYGPNDSTCSGSPVFTAKKSVDDNGIYESHLSPATPFTPTLIGTYRWIANYGGDDKNAATANACNAPNESVIVTGAAAVTAIPTLSEWAMLALAGLMAVVAIVSMRRRMR